MLSMLLIACASEVPVPVDVSPVAPDFRASFAALPVDAATADRPVSPERVELGRLLFFEPRLSKNHDVSCNTCHGLDKYGVDGTPTSTGHKAQKGGRNAPTVYNAALHVAQFWDGRAADVEAQAKGPVLNPIEMAAPSEEHVVGVLKSIPDYGAKFSAAFPGDADPITYDHMGTAIGAFERTLVTPSRFDTWLAGDETALTDAEKAGLATFVQSGCTACHSGALVGGKDYRKIGLIEADPTADTGRQQVTSDPNDAMVFKVPSLRNVAMTGPYFHDGGVADLPAAVRLMGKHQLGKQLTDDEVTGIVSFLGALTGPLPAADRIAPPALPASGPTTPKPDPS
jgi:cytochrome c peroxidase